MSAMTGSDFAAGRDTASDSRTSVRAWKPSSARRRRSTWRPIRAAASPRRSGFRFDSPPKAHAHDGFRRARMALAELEALRLGYRHRVGRHRNRPVAKAGDEPLLGDVEGDLQ